jgi:hypothetical protein
MKIKGFAVGSFVDAILNSGIVASTPTEDTDVEIFSIGDSSMPAAKSRVTRRILICSPGQSTEQGFKTWIKNNRAAIITLPTCSWEEMVAIRNTKSKPDTSLPIRLLRERYDMWGGVPRTTIFDPQLLDETLTELRQLRIQDAQPYMGTYSLDHHRYSGKFFHLFPAFQTQDADFASMSLYKRYTAKPSYWWATARLERQAWQHFRLQQDADVIDFINAVSNDPICRGKSWEAEIHHLVSSCEITGELKDLETDEIFPDFTIQASSTAYFSRFGDINGDAEYWQPVVANHTPGDSYSQGKG